MGCQFSRQQQDSLPCDVYRARKGGHDREQQRSLEHVSKGFASAIVSQHQNVEDADGGEDSSSKSSQLSPGSTRSNSKPVAFTNPTPTSDDSVPAPADNGSKLTPASTRSNSKPVAFTKPTPTSDDSVPAPADNGSTSHVAPAINDVCSGLANEGNDIPVELQGYQVLDVIGSGSYATVYRASNQCCLENGYPKVVAIKVIDVDKVEVHETVPTVDEEVALLQTLDHPYIARLYEVIRSPALRKVSIVMEYVSGGELFERVAARGAMAEEDAALVFAELCEALTYLHSLGIVHRDVKPENICFENDEQDSSIRLIDFGFAKRLSPQPKPLCSEWCGTPKYVAPEQLSGDGCETVQHDMWAVGVTLYILLCGFPPWTADSGRELQDQILNAAYDFPSPWWDTISDDAKALVRSLLTLDPLTRLTAEQATRHPWTVTCGGALSELEA